MIRKASDDLMAKKESKVKDKQRAKNKVRKYETEVKKHKEMDSNVLYICTECGENEEIPMDVVIQFDALDDGDITEPPIFTCEKCGGLMRPKYYEGVHGITYEYNI